MKLIRMAESQLSSLWWAVEQALPQSSPTHLQLGIAYLAAGNLDAARQNLSMAVKAAPDDYRIQLGMAQYEQQIAETGAAENRYHLA